MKIFVAKKNTVICVVLSVFLFVLGLTFALVKAFSARKIGKSDYTIIIDAGHGGKVNTIKFKNSSLFLLYGPHYYWFCQHVLTL